MSLRSASVFAIDVNCPPAALTLAVDLCQRSAETTMMFAPHDELALVLAGTSDSHNPLYHAGSEKTDGAQFKHISVPCAFAAPTVDFVEVLSHVSSPLEERHEVDFLETLFMCDHLLRERTANKSYHRVVYLLTDARTDVARKGEMHTLLQSFQEQGVSLVVIGINFTEMSGACSQHEEKINNNNNNNDSGTRGDGDEKLTELSIKAENERVLHIMCSLLGGASMVTSLEEALQSVNSPQRRKICQRALVKVVLTIGDVRLATQMFTKSQEERMPSLKRTTAAGEDVCTRTVFRSLGDDTAPLHQSDIARAYCYGRSLIPCTDADLEAMKIKGPKSLDAVGFVPLQQVPVYLLLGGVKVVVPLPDDMVGAKAFRSIVRAMSTTNRAMIVRFTRTQDAVPVLGLCVPSTNERRDVLFFSPLPFAEDVRFLRVSDFEEIQDDAEEERLIDSIVEDMTVGKDVLRPRETFNPAIQQYYAALRAKLRRGCNDKEEVEEEQEGEKHDDDVEPIHHPHEGETPVKSNGDGEILNLLPSEAQGKPVALSVLGNGLDSLHANMREKLEACSRTFVYISNKENNDAMGEQRPCWSQLPVAAAAAPSDVDASDAVSAQTLSTVVTVPCFVSGASHVTNVDPVSSFKAMVRSRESVSVQRAMDELADIVLRLLRCSLKDAQYAKCTDCVLLLRQHCVAEGEADYFNSFLLRLMLMSTELGHELFWRDGVVGKSIAPITRRECPSSALNDEEAARRFLTEDRSLPALVLDENTDEDVLKMII